MDANFLSSREIDTIGEILNISLGAASTAISTMLNARVSITIPSVKLRDKDRVGINILEPSICVEITHEEGLTGSNIMLLGFEDACAIVNMLMGTDYSKDTFEVNEITSSAIGEVMNQMMGAAATALSDMLERVVNISPPKTFVMEKSDEIITKYFDVDESVVEINFNLNIEEKANTDFLYLLPIDLAKELVNGFYQSYGMIEEVAIVEEPQIPIRPQEVTEAPRESKQSVNVIEEVEDMAGGQAEMRQDEKLSTEPVRSQNDAKENSMNETLEQMMALMKTQMEMTQNQMMQMQSAMATPIQQQPQQNKKIQVGMPATPNLRQEQVESGYDTNLGLVMGVPVEVSVEIGRTKKLVKDVLELNKGSLVVLDKLAGEQIDLYVNGQCIAQGDVVVVDDNFGIRITEILTKDIPLG